MNIYESVTERILAQLEKGEIPWRKEWKSTGSAGLPFNFQSRKQYRGINILLLMCSGFTDARWLTYKQAQELGLQVRKGEKGTKIVFWSMFNRAKESGPDSQPVAAGDDVERIPFMREYTVFNVEQCDGLAQELPFDAAPFEPIPHAQKIADDYLARAGVTFRNGGNSAYYHPKLDHIQMPEQSAFCSPDAYYSTLFHEMGHSTRHSSRLDRDSFRDSDPHAFGSKEYSREELVAEFTAAFLCAEVGLSSERLESNHTAYIQSWLKALKNDKKMCVLAAQRAQKACDLILDRKFAEQAPAAESVAA